MERSGISGHQAEPRKENLSLGSDLDVGGFEIAMDDAFLMSRFQSIADLQGDLQGCIDWNRPTGNLFLQRLPFD